MLQFFSASTSIVNSKRAITPFPTFPHGGKEQRQIKGEIRKGVLN
jgi:hypothetical protein